LQEALAHDPGEPAPPLEANVVADVCIIGGGFAGLWTAIRLSERAPGMRIALIEQDIVGGGASGRNGGFASSSWFDADAIIALLGEQEGVRYLRVQSEAIEQLGAFAKGHGIDCWFHHEGVLGVRTGVAGGPGTGGQASARERYIEGTV
jgi:glycine/D-amino acid oxidase-like deaminating enzyme